MIYFIAQSNMDLVKIGHTAGQGSKRLSSLQTGNPDPLILLAAIPGGKHKERDLHSRFCEYKHRGEWYFLAGKLKAYVESEAKDMPEYDILKDSAFLAIHRKVTDAVHPPKPVILLDSNQS